MEVVEEVRLDTDCHDRGSRRVYVPSPDTVRPPTTILFYLILFYVFVLRETLSVVQVTVHVLYRGNIDPCLSFFCDTVLLSPTGTLMHCQRTLGAESGHDRLQTSNALFVSCLILSP